MEKCKLSPFVIDGKMIFKVTESVSKLTINDITDESLKSLNIQRFIIRRSQRVTSKEIRDLENKHQRLARS